LLRQQPNVFAPICVAGGNFESSSCTCSFLQEAKKLLRASSKSHNVLCFFLVHFIWFKKEFVQV